jgi:2'-5' RNA ligase
MRLFVAIPLPDDLLSHLERLIQHLRPQAQLSWSRVYNLHVTTRFIGEWPAERLGELQDALGTVPFDAPVPISVRGLGWFPNPHHPRVLFAAVQRAPELLNLANATSAALAPLLPEPEEKAYTPHITLARVRATVPLAGLKQTIAALPSVEFGSFSATQFELFLSEQGPSGPIYTSLAAFPARKAAA